MMAWALLGAATLAFVGLGYQAWIGALGFKALGLLFASTLLWFAGRSRLAPATRGPLDSAAKVAFTIVGSMALLRHPVEGEGGEKMPIYDAIVQYIDQVDGQTFAFYAIVAGLVKFVGVISSAFAWHLLLVGQGIRYPFWSKIMTSFLIGRFIGTFLPSTMGLDGYTLYEAGKYSNQWTRAVTAKTLEKFVGVTGLFMGMLLTLPFGYSVLVDVTTAANMPERAPLLAGLIAAIAGTFVLVVVVGLVWPPIIRIIMWIIRKLSTFVLGIGPLKKISARVLGMLGQFDQAITSYHGKVGLLMMVLLSKFVTHFTTAMVYYFTALAIGVTTAEFWPIVFGSTIQILGTLFSPTIAGEGAREAFQSLLLSNQLGGAAQAVLSAALGFIAAEAATLWGGAFMWTRKPGWRPGFALVDDKQVDYAWIDDSADQGFSAESLKAGQEKAKSGGQS